MYKNDKRSRLGMQLSSKAFAWHLQCPRFDPQYQKKKRTRYCNMPVFLPSLSHFLLSFLLGASQALGKCYTIEYSLSKGRKSI